MENVGVSNLEPKVSAVQAKILKELLADGRKSQAELAKKIGLTEEQARENFEQLEKTGIITGATTHINYKLFGYKAVAHILIAVDAQQENKLSEYLQKMPWVYHFYCREVKGHIDIIAILKTLGQLNDIKDAIKRNFSVQEMKTAIWTDVKEMNENLAIIDSNRQNLSPTANMRPVDPRKTVSSITIDEIDQKIADKLASDGRISMETLAKEIGITTERARRKFDRLKSNGVLKITIQLDVRKLGYHALCVFFTTIKSENLYSIIENISKIPDIISIMKTTGDYDLQIYAMVKNDLDHMLGIQEQIGSIPGISSIDLEITPFAESISKWPSPRQYISTF